MSTVKTIELFPMYSMNETVFGYTPHGADTALYNSLIDARNAIGVLESYWLLHTLAEHVKDEEDTDLFLRVLHGIVDAESQGFVNHELAVWALMIVGKCEEAIHREV